MDLVWNVHTKTSPRLYVTLSSCYMVHLAEMAWHMPCGGRYSWPIPRLKSVQKQLKSLAGAWSALLISMHVQCAVHHIWPRV